MIKRKKIDKYIIDGKEVILTDVDWDFLVILDACRYDIFKKIYREFFNDSVLKKAISPATWTLEWLEKTFKDFYGDIIYISPNPFINSKKKILFQSSAGDWREFDAKKHFFKIIDVWKFGWDDAVGQTLPRNVNKAFHRTYLKHPKKRFIIHYMQPHAPYLTMGGRWTYSNKPVSQPSLNTSNKLFYILKWIIRKRFLGDEVIWKIRKKLGKNFDSCSAIAFDEGGRKKVKEIYKNEVKLVLKYVKMLTESIKGKWIITADHGERLGERHGWYGHNHPRDKWVTEVPFMYLNNNKRT